MTKFYTTSNINHCADNKIKVIQKFKICFGKKETLLEKEKVQVTSIYSFSDNVFKSLFSQGC